ncbi:hypothetical protein LCGC14_0924470 [marine sediment metagenome]|uniref:Uncharacterized protein n=1 Tax=marine sediment metagenome TaxID=412755 RepID=A0A0F9NPV7_9ZZZZ
MSNFIFHYNDPDTYYDLARISQFNLLTPLQINYISADVLNVPPITETFTSEPERQLRLEKILIWSNANGDQFRS